MMNGSVTIVAEDERHDDWVHLALEAVGNVIEFWGFKRNQGRVWAYLYIINEPKTAAEIQAELVISKGGVSMLLRELEYWKVIKRVRVSGQRSWHFVACNDLREMISRVLREREASVIESVCEDLKRAEDLAKDAGAPDEIQERLRKMVLFSEGMKTAIDLFISGASLDIKKSIDSFRNAPVAISRRLSRRRSK